MSLNFGPPFYEDKKTEPPKSGQMNNYLIYSSLLPQPTLYSYIYLCSEIHGQDKKVIKFIKFYKDRVERVLDEVQLLQETSHANIITCEAAFREGPYWCIILPYSPERSLLTYLNNRGGRFSESTASFFMRQMIKSIDHLHNTGIFHRDVKLDNFIVFIDKETNTPQVCLSDFGFAKRFNRGEKCSNEFFGTLEYLAPEIVKKEEYDESADVWALGICLFKMLTGKFPVPDSSLYQKNCPERIIDGRLSFDILQSLKISIEATELIKSMCDVDPSKRISTKQALNHSWIKNGEKSQIERSCYQFLGCESQFLSAPET